MDFLKNFGISSPSFSSSFYGVGGQYIWLPEFSDVGDSIKTSEDKVFSILNKAAKKHYCDWHFMRYAMNPEDMRGCKELVLSMFSSFDEIVLLGTGGSSLGAKALCELQSSGGFSEKKIHFFDNVDPGSFEVFAKKSSLDRVGVLVITKSGGTPETLAQLTYFIDLWKKVQGKDAIAKQFICITEPKDSPVSRLAKLYKIRCLAHDTLLGGRFSVVSKVGLLPFFLTGGDSDLFQQGLEQVAKYLLAPEKLPAVSFVAAHNFLEKKCCLDDVIVTVYGDAWRYVPTWFMQLWAESLGKQGKGTMPIGSLGTQDQHSLLQLFLDGPNNKFFTIIISKDYGKTSVLQPEDMGLDYLRGKTLGDLMEAEAWATVRTLVERKAPVRVLHLDVLKEKALGVVMLNWMLETALQAGVWGVDAFDQPAVEKGKILTKEYLGR